MEIIVYVAWVVCSGYNYFYLQIRGLLNSAQQCQKKIFLEIFGLKSNVTVNNQLQIGWSRRTPLWNPRLGGQVWSMWRLVLYIFICRKWHDLIFFKVCIPCQIWQKMILFCSGHMWSAPTDCGWHSHWRQRCLRLQGGGGILLQQWFIIDWVEYSFVLCWWTISSLSSTMQKWVCHIFKCDHWLYSVLLHHFSIFSNRVDLAFFLSFFFIAYRGWMSGLWNCQWWMGWRFSTPSWVPGHNDVQMQQRV